MSCKYDTGRGATYDLSELSILTSNGGAKVRDYVQTSQSDFVYTFGICHSVLPPDNCLDAAGKSRVRFSSSPGWQTKASETRSNMPAGKEPSCVYLGNPNMEDNKEWSLIDSDDPGKGVQLKYTGGQHCTSGQRRSLEINFLCSANHIEKIEKQVIDESKHCAYAITIESEYACPLECGFG